MQIKAWDSVAQKVNFNLEIDLSNFEQLVSFGNAILDYGCGYGRTCEILSSQGYQNVVGVDTSPEMIKRGLKENPNLSLIQNNEIKTNFSDNHFDTIVLCAVLTCIPEIRQKEKVIIEINRLLKPGGILHMVEFCSDSDRLFESNLRVAMHHQKPKNLYNLLKPFTKIKCQIFQTKTMAGTQTKAMSFFGKKEL
ncbi:MAG: class I SAM-dependent methyltransferase [Desulfotalea sp.]